MFRLDGKTVLIAGHEGRIGSAVNDLFQKAGAEIVGVDIEDGNDIFDEAYLRRLHARHSFSAFVDCSYPGDWGRRVSDYCQTVGFIADRMAEQRGGAIVLLGSIYGNVAADLSLYDDTSIKMAPMEYGFVKAGLVSLARDISVRYPGVRANIVSPGGIQDRQDEKFVKRYCRKVPGDKKRMATAQDVANACLFLVADESEYIVGQEIVVDGGFTII